MGTFQGCRLHRFSAFLMAQSNKVDILVPWRVGNGQQNMFESLYPGAEVDFPVVQGFAWYYSIGMAHNGENGWTARKSWGQRLCETRCKLWQEYLKMKWSQLSVILHHNSNLLDVVQLSLFVNITLNFLIRAVLRNLYPSNTKVKSETKIHSEVNLQ